MSSLQFARDDFGNRILPFPKGRGFCPVCEGVMVAKCGDIYRWHWQHVRDRNCDSWKEHETLWHRQWKEKFPAECREVIIQEDGEKHIADVLTKSGTVIEFQNSSISAGTILIREAFYGKMVWVVNANLFSDNFTIRSTVKRKLWELDHYRELDKNLNYDYDWNVSDFDRKIKSLAHERDIFKMNSEREQALLKTLESINEKIDDYVHQAKTSWDGSQYIFYPVPGLSDISGRLKAGYSERMRQIRQINLKLSEEETVLRQINNMTPYYYQGIKYVIAEFKELRPDLLDRCIIISKADQDSMFPTVLKFRSELDFHAYQYKTADYLFAVDPSKTLERLNLSIQRLKADLELLELDMPDYASLLKQEFSVFIQNELKLNEERFYKAEENQMEVQSKIYTLEIQKEEYEDECRSEYEKDQEQERVEYEAEKSRIMKTYKGRYSFVWKKERKSWSDATCPIYFDIGKDYLFERVSPNSLVKISTADFLAKFL